MIEKYALIKVIRFLIQTHEEHSLRSVSRKAGVSASTAKTCLDYLSSKKIVDLKVVGKVHQYRLNTENIITRHIKILTSLILIVNSGLVEEIKNKYPVNSIVLYGSVARGEDDPKSDIDILIISRKKIKMEPLKSTKSLKREVTFLTFTKQEWREKAKTDKVFYDRVIVDGITLYGELPVIL